MTYKNSYQYLVKIPPCFSCITMSLFSNLEPRINFRWQYFRCFTKTSHKFADENTASPLLPEKNIIPIKMAYTSHELTKVTSESSKPPVIIMHGLLGSRNNWNTLSKMMNRNTSRKIIAVDARNHGDSPHSPEFSYSHLTEDVRTLMSFLGIPKASLIGHSMGGRAMMLAALKYPSLVEKLVIVDISPVSISSSLGIMKNYFEAMKRVKLEKNITISTARKSAEEQLKEAVPDSMLRLFLITNLIEDKGSFKWRVNLDAISENFFAKMIDFPARIPPFHPFQGPTLFVIGEKSDFVSPRDHEKIKEFFPNADFVYVPDAGHWVHSDKPKEFTDIVCCFLRDSSE